MSDDNLRKYYANQLKRQEYLKIGFKQGFEAGYAKAKEDFERPRGEWIEHRQYYMNYFVSEYECSNCRDEVWQETEWQFCPNCGADMREGETE